MCKFIIFINLFIYIGYAKFTAHAILAKKFQPDPEELEEAFRE
jgi:hypothetical protein